MTPDSGSWRAALCQRQDSAGNGLFIASAVTFQMKNVTCIIFASAVASLAFKMNGFSSTGIHPAQNKVTKNNIQTLFWSKLLTKCQSSVSVFNLSWDKFAAQMNWVVIPYQSETPTLYQYMMVQYQWWLHISQTPTRCITLTLTNPW